MFRRLWKREKGQTLVEMALVAPILFVVVFMGISLLLGAGAKAVVEDAAREGARWAALGLGSPATIVDQVLAENNLSVTSSNPVVSTSTNGSYVTVTVQYNQPTLVPGVMGLLPGGGGPGQYYTLVGASTMKVE